MPINGGLLMTQKDLEGNEVRSTVIEGEEEREPLAVFQAGNFVIKVTDTALKAKLKLKKKQTTQEKEGQLKHWVQKSMRLNGSTADDDDWAVAMNALWQKFCAMIGD